MIMMKRLKSVFRPNTAFRTACGSRRLVLPFLIIACFVLGTLVSHAEEKKETVTIEEGKEQLAGEWDRKGEHAENIKKAAKEDTTSAGKSISEGFKSGFKIIKEGIKSMRRGEGVPADKHRMEELEP